MAAVYLDECLDGNHLIGLLRRSGHTVQFPRQAGTVGLDDADHLE